MIKLSLIILLLIQVNAQFLEKDEIERLKRGNVFRLQSDEKQMQLEYDIWRNSYLLRINSKSKRFKKERELFEYLHDDLKIKSIYIIETEQSDASSDIFLIDLVDSVIRKFKRRKIEINEKL